MSAVQTVTRLSTKRGRHNIRKIQYLAPFPSKAKIAWKQQTDAQQQILHRRLVAETRTWETLDHCTQTRTKMSTISEMSHRFNFFSILGDGSLHWDSNEKLVHSFCNLHTLDRDQIEAAIRASTTKPRFTLRASGVDFVPHPKAGLRCDRPTDRPSDGTGAQSLVAPPGPPRS